MGLFVLGLLPLAYDARIEEQRCRKAVTEANKELCDTSPETEISETSKETKDTQVATASADEEPEAPCSANAVKNLGPHAS